MALPLPPKQLARQRKRDGKYADKQRAKNNKRRQEAIQRMKDFEEEQKRRKQAERHVDNSPTAGWTHSDPFITFTITDTTRGGTAPSGFTTWSDR